VALPLIGLQFHDVELRITWSPYLTQNITIGPTTYPVLSAVPNGSINVFSVSQGSLAWSNVANLVVSQTTGPIFPGMLLASATSNLQANVVVVQGFSANAVASSSNIAWANIMIAGSSTGIVNAAAIFSTSVGGALKAYAPVISAEIPLAIAAGTALSTTKSITLTELASFNGTGTITVGQYVAGLPWAGPVYVSSTSNIANSNVTVTYPSQRSGPVLAGITIAFFAGTSNTTTNYSQVQYQAWSNFVYLDQSERDWFAKEKQDLLITQVQRVVMGTNPVQELALAQPIKFIAFPCVNYNQIFANGAGSETASNYQLKTQVNGVDVGDSRHMMHWVDVPQYYNTPWGYIHNNATANVAIISYCLDTSKLQPTGTLNFSRLDNFRLVVPSTLPNGIQGLASTSINYPTQYLYAVNYNVFRIQNGLGSLLYAN
jgi:hypothetical protein